MTKLKECSIKIHVDNPSIRQRWIILVSNFTLWLLSKFFDGDELESEIKDVILLSYRAIEKYN